MYICKYLKLTITENKRSIYKCSYKESYLKACKNNAGSVIKLICPHDVRRSKEEYAICYIVEA